LVITFFADGNDAKILNEVQNRFAVQITEMPDDTDLITYSKYFFFIL
jgi:ATP-dependent RNA helicase UAP56/SUB2